MDLRTIRSLSLEDEKTFQLYKADIRKAVCDAFPSLPTDFEAKAAGVNVVNACALLYTYMIVLPDDKFAKVRFTIGGDLAPGMERKGPTFKVDPVLHSSIDA